MFVIIEAIVQIEVGDEWKQWEQLFYLSPGLPLEVSQE